MYTVAAFTESLGNVTNDDLTALNDEIIAISNGHLLPQVDYELIFAAGLGPNTDRIRIVSPSNRQITLPFIRPINVAALPANDPNVADFRDNPFRIKGMEELAVEATTNAVGPSRVTVLLGLSQGVDPIPRGDVFSFRGTSTTAAVANTWTTITTTFADILPQGNFVCVGGEVFSTNAIAWRAIFENQVMRPGGLGINALANRTHSMFYKGGLGVLGRFRSTRLPIIQVLANAADAVHEVYLDIVRVM